MKKLLPLFISFLFVSPCLHAQNEENEQKAMKQALVAFRLINRYSAMKNDRVSNVAFMDESRYNFNRSTNDFYSPSNGNYFNNSRYISSPGTYTAVPPSFYMPSFRPDRILDDAVILLKECEKLDPASIVYPLHIGFAYYLEGDYRKAIKKIMRLQYDPQAKEIVFQLLAKCYLESKDEKNAIKTLEKGMSTFPKAGSLYQEMGFYYLNKKDTISALATLEQGILVQPSLSSLYETIGIIHHWQNNLHQSLAYTEIFMSMEPASYHFKGAAMRLFNTATKIFKIDPAKIPRNVQASDDDSVRGTAYLDAMVDQMLKAGYMDTTFGANLAVAKRLQQYKSDIVKQGFASEYLHWLLQQSDMSEFAAWKLSYLDKWNAFGKWFNEYNGFAQAVERKRKSSGKVVVL